jgi:hypothetical protein
MLNIARPVSTDTLNSPLPTAKPIAALEVLRAACADAVLVAKPSMYIVSHHDDSELGYRYLLSTAVSVAFM